MRTQEFDWIDRYLNGELSQQDLAEFERQMEANSEFKQEVELYRKVKQGLIYDRSRKMFEKLKQHESEKYSHEYKPKGIWLRVSWMRVAAVLIFGSGFVYLYVVMNDKNDEPSMVMPSVENKQEEIVLPRDSIISNTEWVETAEETVNIEEIKKQKLNQNKKAIDPEEIYLAYFEPIKDESLFSGSRSEEELEPYEVFLNMYKEGHYEAALSAFDSLSPIMQSMPEALFVKANVLMALNKTGDAELILKDLLRYDPFIYRDEIRWLYGLCLVKAYNLENAKIIFRGLFKSKHNLIQTQAVELFDDLR